MYLPFYDVYNKWHRYITMVSTLIRKTRFRGLCMYLPMYGIHNKWHGHIKTESTHI